jgi:hypothetical protein
MLGRHSFIELHLYPQIYIYIYIYSFGCTGLELRTLCLQHALYCLSHIVSPFGVDLSRELPVPL